MERVAKRGIVARKKHRKKHLKHTAKTEPKEASLSEGEFIFMLSMALGGCIVRAITSKRTDSCVGYGDGI